MNAQNWTLGRNRSCYPACSSTPLIETLQQTYQPTTLIISMPLLKEGLSLLSELIVVDRNLMGTSSHLVTETALNTWKRHHLTSRLDDVEVLIANVLTAARVSKRRRRIVGQGIMAFHGNLQAQPVVQDTFRVALAFLALDSQGDDCRAGSASLLLDHIVDNASKCQAAHHEAIAFLLAYIHSRMSADGTLPTTSTTTSPLFSRWAARMGDQVKSFKDVVVSSTTSSPTSTTPPAAPSPSVVAKGQQWEADVASLHASFAMFLDAHKRSAFESAFIQPTLIVYELARRDVEAGDVVVHGSNTYLCLLDMFLGIKCPRLSFRKDGIAGIYRFLNRSATGTDIGAVVDTYLESTGRTDTAAATDSREFESFGKNWQSLPSLKNSVNLVCQGGYGLSLGRNGHTIINEFFIPGPNVNDVVSALQNRCVSAVWPYLYNFAYYFSEDFLMPRLWAHFVQSDQMVLLQRVFEKMHEDMVVSTEDFTAAEENVGYWVYGDVSDPSACFFHPPRFRALCDVVGITRAAEMDSQELSKQLQHIEKAFADDSKL